MTPMLSIRPSRDLRTHYAQVAAQTREGPVAITVNGRQDTVLLSHEDYMAQRRHLDELEAQLSVYAHLARAADDVKLGRVQDAEDAFDEILGELEGGSP